MKWYMVFYTFSDRFGGMAQGRVPCCTKRLTGATFNDWASKIAQLCEVPQVAITNAVPMDGE